jgi:hypothetical protein
MDCEMVSSCHSAAQAAFQFMLTVTFSHAPGPANLNNHHLKHLQLEIQLAPWLAAAEPGAACQ